MPEDNSPFIYFRSLIPTAWINYFFGLSSDEKTRLFLLRYLDELPKKNMAWLSDEKKHRSDWAYLHRCGYIELDPECPPFKTHKFSHEEKKMIWREIRYYRGLTLKGREYLEYLENKNPANYWRKVVHDYAPQVGLALLGLIGTIIGTFLAALAGAYVGAQLTQ